MENDGKEISIGPKRVVPGYLSVSRTFGDPQGKITSLGGKPGVISAVPDIKSFKITSNHDYIVLASDGIYDKMSNKDIMNCILMTLEESKVENKHNVHEVCAAAAECIVKNSLLRETTDNVTVVMIAFKHFEDLVIKKLRSEYIKKTTITTIKKSEKLDSSTEENDKAKNSDKTEKRLSKNLGTKSCNQLTRMKRYRV